MDYNFKYLKYKRKYLENKMKGGEPGDSKILSTSNINYEMLTKDKIPFNFTDISNQLEEIDQMINIKNTSDNPQNISDIDTKIIIDKISQPNNNTITIYFDGKIILIIDFMLKLLNNEQLENEITYFKNIIYGNELINSYHLLINIITVINTIYPNEINPKSILPVEYNQNGGVVLSLSILKIIHMLSVSRTIRNMLFTPSINKIFHTLTDVINGSQPIEYLLLDISENNKAEDIYYFLLLKINDKYNLSIKTTILDTVLDKLEEVYARIRRKPKLKIPSKEQFNNFAHRTGYMPDPIEITQFLLSNPEFGDIPAVQHDNLNNIIIRIIRYIESIQNGDTIDPRNISQENINQLINDVIELNIFSIIQLLDLLNINIYIFT